MGSIGIGDEEFILQPDVENSVILGFNMKAQESNTIVFGIEGVEVLKFTKDKMFIHGKENDCPEDLIDSLRSWLKTMTNG